MIPHSRPWITDTDKAAVNSVLDSGLISRGKSVRRFEQALSKYFGGGQVRVTTSGRQAITLALELLGVGKGDEIIIPTYVCKSVADAVRAIGASPILADCGSGWSISSDSVEAIMSHRTKAIIVAHVFGIAADIKAILKLNLPLIEDCAQSFGLMGVSDFPADTSNVISTFSFNATKCLTTGEGGALLVRSSELQARLQALLSRKDPDSISDLQAVLGLSQLDRYSHFLDRRKSISERYFSGIDERLYARLKPLKKQSIFFRFPLTVEQPVSELIKTLDHHGIAARQGVDALIHRGWKISDNGFKNAVDRFNHTLSIPILPDLTQTEVDHVIDAVNKVCIKNSC